MNKNFIALKGIVVYEIKRIIRIWRQTLIPPLMNMSLYFLIFGHFIGSKVPAMAGHSYMSFLIPGLIMMSVIMESYNASVFPFFMSKFHRSIEEILIAPVPNVVIITGFALGGIIRGLFIGLLVTLVASLFNPIAPAHPVVLIFAALTASCFFSLLGFSNALFAKNFEDISIVPTFILTPLVYLGGVFYSIEQLSPFWQKVSMFNPIVYIINIFRYGFLDTGSSYLFSSLFVLVLLIILTFSLNIYWLERGTRLKT